MSMSTVHAPNGHEQDTGAPRKVDRDAELVERLRRQEPGAPEALVETYGDRVYRLAIRITGNEQDAEEVVQDAQLRSRQGQRNEISWDAMSPGFDELGQHAEPLRDWSARTEEPALQTELRSLLTTAIDDLPGDYKTAFLLHDVEGLSNPEIAETLHISLPAVKSRVHRSRLFLRQRLADYMRAA